MGMTKNMKYEETSSMYVFFLIIFHNIPYEMLGLLCRENTCVRNNIDMCKTERADSREHGWPLVWPSANDQVRKRGDFEVIPRINWLRVN